MTKITPISELGRRVQEQGRIRMGRKTNTRQGREALGTWRFTSQDHDAIREIAELYGGTPQRWDEPKALPNQMEVITEASTVRVLVTPGSLSQHYELWTEHGCQRRCDGVECEVPISMNDTVEYDTVRCPCEHVDKALMCKVKTRVTVLMPEISFRGGWRLETSSARASEELPGMAQLMEHVQQQGMTEAELSIVDGKSGAGKTTKRYKYPQISPKGVSLEQLAQGAATFDALTGPKPSDRRELGAGATHVDDLDDVELHETGPIHDGPINVDSEIVDGEIVEEGPWRTKAEAIKAGKSNDEIEKRDGKWVVK